jgi:hypothetical protein
MARFRLSFIVSTALVMLVIPGLSWGQQASSEPGNRDPQAAVSEARSDFEAGNYGEAVETLGPWLEPIPQIEDTALRKQAHELFAVNLYFQSRKAQDKQRRSFLVKQARKHFLELLRLDAEHELDPLIYPESVIGLLDKVRQANRDELEALKRVKAGETSGSGGPNSTIYIERIVERPVYALNFVPFGAGQFQNGDTVKGGLFAGGQTVAIGINLTSFVIIEHLRNPDGRFSQENFQTAGRLQNAQYGALIGFGVLYIASVIDALYNYKARKVIRTKGLDSPPAGLQNQKGATTSGETISFDLSPLGVKARW